MSDNYIENMEIIHPEKADWYKIHKIPKRSGGIRIIEEPVDWLKDAQRDIYNNILLPNYKLSAYAYGSVKGRNIADAAALHVDSEKVLRMDLSNFFWSVDSNKIEAALASNENIDSVSLSQVVYLCTNKYGVLPQGGVTSPALANLAAGNLYNLLGNVSASMNLKFSAYLDDMIFSGENPGRIIPVAKKAILARDFLLNEKKTCIMHGKQEVLGLCVVKDIDHTRLPRRKRDKIRGLLHRLAYQVQYNTVDYGLYKYVEGLVAFAYMAKDQKAAIFKEKLDRIKQGIQRLNNVRTCNQHRD